MESMESKEKSINDKERLKELIRLKSYNQITDEERAEFGFSLHLSVGLYLGVALFNESVEYSAYKAQINVFVEREIEHCQCMVELIQASNNLPVNSSFQELIRKRLEGLMKTADYKEVNKAHKYLLSGTKMEKDFLACANRYKKRISPFK
jgi:hypothetical protein